MAELLSVLNQIWNISLSGENSLNEHREIYHEEGHNLGRQVKFDYYRDLHKMIFENKSLHCYRVKYVQISDHDTR